MSKPDKKKANRLAARVRAEEYAAALDEAENGRWRREAVRREEERLAAVAKRRAEAAEAARIAFIIDDYRRSPHCQHRPDDAALDAEHQAHRKARVNRKRAAMAKVDRERAARSQEARGRPARVGMAGNRVLLATLFALAASTPGPERR